MKNNRKNRKLQYIRTKNNIRLRKKFFHHWFKVPIGTDASVIDKEINETMAYFTNKYRLSLSIKTLNNMTTATDVIKNLTTYSMVIEKA